MVFSLEVDTLDELVDSRISLIDNISQISGVARVYSGLRDGCFKGFLAQSHHKLQSEEPIVYACPRVDFFDLRPHDGIANDQ